MPPPFKVTIGSLGSRTSNDSRVHRPLRNSRAAARVPGPVLTAPPLGVRWNAAGDEPDGWVVCHARPSALAPWLQSFARMPGCADAENAQHAVRMIPLIARM